MNIFRFKQAKERPESLEHRDSPNYYWNIGMAISALMMVLILVGYIWTPYSTTEMSGRDKFLSPCLRHPLGTDNFGRDLLSRIMEGAGSTFLIALCVILIGGIIGTIIGSLTGYFGGMADVVLMRICDAITAFPSILLALVLIAVIGMGKYQIILILGILFIPSFARVVRGEVAKQRTLNYVQAARLMGASHMRIIFLHILPNTIQVLLPILTIGASCTAMCRSVHVLLESTGSPAKAYLTTWRREWKQATAIWLFLLAFVAIATAEILWVISFKSISVSVLLLTILTALVFLSTSAYVFPLLSRFDNTTFQMLKNGLILVFAHPLKTFLIMISNLLPAVMLVIFPYWFLRLGFIWLTLGFSLICYSNMRLLRPVFSALESTSVDFVLFF